jgi:hypothetical protein
MSFKLGADPELFLKDASEAFVSVIGKIGGTKQNPMPLPLGEGFCVQEDNVALEYNIPACGSKGQLVHNIEGIMKFLSDHVNTMGLHFAKESAAIFPEEQLKDPRAMEFGCDPDYDAWRDGDVNMKPKANDWRLRSCGGHIHIGHKFKKIDDLITFIKYMDLYLAVPSTIMDTGDMRKQLYGKAGAFRVKPYGGEYRVLSNYWTLDRKLIEWVWDATSLAMDSWQNKKVDVDTEKEAILAAINDNNKEAARMLIGKYSLLVA